MPGFVIEYNRASGTRRVTSFPGAEGHRQALRKRLLLERERTDFDVEIVSLVSDSLDTVQETHSRYFQGRDILPSR